MENPDNKQAEKPIQNNNTFTFPLILLATICLWTGLTFGSVYWYESIQSRHSEMDLTPLLFLFGFPLLAFFIGLYRFSIKAKRDAFTMGSMYFPILALLLGISLLAI